MTKNKHSTVKGIKLGFSPGESVTSFGGLALVRRLMLRLGVDTLLAHELPHRGGYSLAEVAVAATAGLLSGARGTVATEPVRRDPALLALLGLGAAPEEATFWRALGDAGATAARGGFARVSLALARRIVDRAPRAAMVDSGFVPLFVDGTLLEGSPRREGTKSMQDKGRGLVWTVAFLGPVPVAQRLAAAGEGESEVTHARALLVDAARGVLAPAGLADDALVLMDSLHGNGPTLDVVEELGLSYVVGARGLVRAQTVLAEQPESQWTPTPEYDERSENIEESAVCIASLQCEDWTRKRTLVGRRWKKKGEFVWNYSAVLTNLDADDDRLALDKRRGAYARRIWALYDRKGACENHFKNLLADLGLHHPPCCKWQPNAGFYALGLLAGQLGVACDVLGSDATAHRTTIATLRRWVFAIPARITRHARSATATILGLDETWRAWTERRFQRLARC